MNQPKNNSKRYHRKRHHRNAPKNEGTTSSKNRRRRRSSKPLGSNQVLQKYDNLLEQHLNNRKKYFELFHRADPRQKNKLERNFYASIEQLRKFEENLKDWQKVYLQKKTERYRLDLTYSSNHELDPEAAVLISADQIDDPHFTDSQKEAYEVYKEDTEESVGSIEDYQKYKESK